MNRINTLSPPDVLVFATNIVNENDLMVVRSLMADDARIRRLTVDLTDCDKVLRIEAHDLHAEEISARLSRAGFVCREL